MSEDVWKLTGYNRHPSVLRSFTTEVLPIVENSRPLKIATVPCATGIESIAIAIALDKTDTDFEIDGFDIDTAAVQAARTGRYILSSTGGQIIGDPTTDYDYQGSNFSHDDFLHYFDRGQLPTDGTILPKDRIISRLSFKETSIVDIPEDQYDALFCLNFLKYLTDPRFSPDLPNLSTVATALFNATKQVGALMVDPTSDKVPQINHALADAGYSKSGEGIYLKF